MSCTERIALVGLLLVLTAGTSCAAVHEPPRAVEAPVRLLDLSGPLTDRRAEVSGMAWAADTLVVLPQDPLLFAESDHLGFFVFTRTQILEALDDPHSDPLEPYRVECEAPGMARIVRGFDGLEAMGILGDRIYLTVEARDDTAMAGYLLCGHYDRVAEAVRIDMTRLTAIPLGLNLPNIAEEALLIDGDRIITMSEANGRNVNPEPRAKIFDPAINYLGSMPFPQIEYRVTDATDLDERGRFWVMNYFYPPEGLKLLPAADPEIERFGLPPGQDPRHGVERLLELRLTDEGIVRTNTPPIYFERATDGGCRNWEALVRLGDRGFLVMTDKYPGTLLGFVPNPHSAPGETE